MKHPSRLGRRLVAVLIAAGAGLGLGSATGADASAAVNAPSSATGATPGAYVRVANLSPDSPDLDIVITAADGGAAATRVDPSGSSVPPSESGVRYGTISEYEPRAAGAYLVCVRRSAASRGDAALLAETMTLAASKVYTIAAVGRRADLGLRIVEDAPDALAGAADAGSARLRVVQASLRWPRVDVTVAGGPVLARAAQFTTIGRYQAVAPGRTSLVIAADGGDPAVARTVAAELEAGARYSLVILDVADGGGGPIVQVRMDLAGVADVPLGGVAAGRGSASAPQDGLAQGSQPAMRLTIPAVELDTDLSTVGKQASGVLAPPRVDQAAWYDRSALPGSVGPAVVVGHVDSSAGAAVFFRLSELSPGDEIQIERQGQRYRYRVVAVGRYPKIDFPASAVYGPTPDPQLRLITCGGAFDPDGGSYLDNIVVFAVAG